MRLRRRAVPRGARRSTSSFKTVASLRDDHMCATGERRSKLAGWQSRTGCAHARRARATARQWLAALSWLAVSQQCEDRPAITAPLYAQRRVKLVISHGRMASQRVPLLATIAIEHARLHTSAAEGTPFGEVVRHFTSPCATSLAPVSPCPSISSPFASAPSTADALSPSCPCHSPSSPGWISAVVSRAAAKGPGAQASSWWRDPASYPTLAATLPGQAASHLGWQCLRGGPGPA